MTTQLDSSTATKRSQLLKVNDVAQLLNVKPRTIYEMVAQDRIPYRKPPGSNILRFDLVKSSHGPRPDRPHDIRSLSTMKNRCSFILILLYSASARGCTSGKDHDNVSLQTRH